MIFPWQIQQWQQLWRSIDDHRLPHALLFSGFAGTGKAIFADSFARTLLCQQVVDAKLAVHVEEQILSYCNTCHACRLIAGDAHPNVMTIEPEKEGQAIKVDQIRAVSDFINQTSLQGDYRIVIINPADDMNANAANALLKTLEEPSSGALIILISHQHTRLPATIVSRCQRILFPRPQTEAALAWLQQATHSDTLAPEFALPISQSQAAIDKLVTDHTTFSPDLLLQLAHGAPLAALRLLQADGLSVRKNLLQTLCALNQKQINPIQAAAELQANDAMQLLDFILTWVMDLLRLQLSVTLAASLEHDNLEAIQIVNQDYVSQLTALKTQTHAQRNTSLIEYLLQLRKQMLRGINLNKQLLLESIFIRWVECGKDYVSS